MKKLTLLFILLLIGTGQAASIKKGRCLYTKSNDKPQFIIYEVFKKDVMLARLAGDKFYVDHLKVATKKYIKANFKVKKCFGGMYE